MDNAYRSQTASIRERAGRAVMSRGQLVLSSSWLLCGNGDQVLVDLPKIKIKININFLFDKRENGGLERSSG